MEKGKSIALRAQSSNTVQINPDLRQSIAKKRPQTTKLDLEQMFQQSIQLTKLHKALVQENMKLKEEYSKVEQTKLSRQNLISAVEKAVQEKVQQLPSKNVPNSSWLVFKLNRQIYDLKNKIELKEKTIRTFRLSKENQMLRQKQIELKCLEQIIQWAENENLLSIKHVYDQKSALSQETIRQTVWMEQFLRTQQQEILEVESLYEEEQREVRKIVEQLATKKVQLKNIKEMEEQYHRTQEKYKEEKRKKENKMAGNKTYIHELQEQRNQQLRKLEQLKARFSQIQNEENKEIRELEHKLAELEQEYQMKVLSKEDLIFQAVSEEKAKPKLEKWAKHVKYEEVAPIAANLNHILSLKRVSQQQYNCAFFSEHKDSYNVLEIQEKLRNQPFALKSEQQCEKFARYMIEDSDSGSFLLDLTYEQQTPIIRSILNKMIGQVRVYTMKEEKQKYQRVGEIISKFHSLVTQAIEHKEGTHKQVAKQKFIEALQVTELDLTLDDMEFIVLFLFSLSLNIKKLELNKLEKFGKMEVRWIKIDNSTIVQNSENPDKLKKEVNGKNGNNEKQEQVSRSQADKQVI